jgi:aspartyl-tRNA(Asn)/glutamyl-tRNA(Gln) amidotransferase subunit B
MLPAARRHRLAERSGSELVQTALIVERGLDDLCLAAIDAGADPARTIPHAEHNLSDERAVGLDPKAFARLVTMETEGKLTATQAKTVLAELVASGGDPAQIATAHGFEAMDTSELDGLVDGLIAGHPDEWQRFCDGDAKITGFFVGKVMKATQGKADGKVVTALLTQRRG